MEVNTSKRKRWFSTRVFALTQENATPINYSMSLQVFAAMVASAFSMTYTFAFLPEMVLHFGYKEEEKGYYAGVIGSTFFAGRIIGSYFWGWLSDKRGPKLVILINCALMALANVGFGLSVNVVMAAGMRLLCGVPSGIVAVLKSVLRDISDATNQSLYLSIISLGWAVGMVLGPLAGGYLSQPARRYPAVLGGVGLLRQFPYFLAASLSAAIFLVVFFIILWKWDSNYAGQREDRKHHDTVLELKTAEGQYDKNDQSPEAENSEKKEALLKQLRPEESESQADIRHHGLKKESEEIVTSDVDDTIMSEGSSLVRKRDAVDNKMAKKQQSIHSSSENVVISTNEVPHESISVESQRKTGIRRICNWNLFRLLRMRTYRQSVSIYALTSACHIGYDALFAIWASTEVRLNGLGFQPDDIGRFVSIAALPLAFLQLFVYPKLEMKLGAKRVFNVFCYVLIFLLTVTAATRILLPRPPALWGCLLTLHALNGFSEGCTFASVTLFINNSVPRSIVGSANGMSMTLGSLTRTFAPTVCGSVFAWSITSGANIGFPFDVNCMFILLGGIYFICNCMCIVLPPSVDGKQREVK